MKWPIGVQAVCVINAKHISDLEACAYFTATFRFASLQILCLYHKLHMYKLHISITLRSVYISSHMSE